MDSLGLTRLNQKLNLTQFRPGCLGGLPWGAEEYDCFVLIRTPLLTDPDLDRLALEIAGGRNDWVQTLGPGCEALHDAIDRASVHIGRQAAVGDGSPMTSWHEDRKSLESMIDLVLGGSLGASDHVLALIVGSEADYAEALQLARSKIASRLPGNC